ncbi:MAG: 2-oxoacid:acceptor oxidoreductase subunit alpha [Candidatus Magasanikbacteria bacterium]
MKNAVITVMFGGAAGDGIKEAGVSLGKLLTRYGQEVFISNEYPSLIRGGHNYCRVSFGTNKVFSDHKQVDVLVAFNDESISLHQKEIKKGGVVISETNLPMSELVKQAGAPKIVRTAVALGALCRYLNIDLEELNKIFIETFGKKGKADLNIKLAEAGYDINISKVKADSLALGLKVKKTVQNKILADGNLAFAEGMLKAGLQMYIAYPMTPASTILHYLAGKPPALGFKAVHPESELGAVNMAVGAAYAGARVATGSSGGGFALMEESFSLAGITEVPLVVAISQRPGPATGVPTGTAQADLQMARFAGHGEFPRLVLAPGDADEAFQAGMSALNWAWKFQIPVIVLLDKHLSESLMTCDFSKIKAKVESGKLSKGGGEYKRYELTRDGISPLAFPGTVNTVIKANSYEHDEFGISIEDALTTQKMNDKRWCKLPDIIRAVSKEAIKIYGDKTSKNVILFWGSTKGAVLEALKFTKKSYLAIQILCLEPFPKEQMNKILKTAKSITVIEGNITGQLASIIREQTGVEIKNKILKCDGRPFEVEEVIKLLV